MSEVDYRFIEILDPILLSTYSGDQSLRAMMHVSVTIGFKGC